MTIVPTPGRVVWFHPARGSSLFKELKNSSTPLGALVAQVNDDGTINLCVASARGDSVAVQNVRLFQADEPLPPFGAVDFARWMPYQVGQAEKTRVAEERINDQLRPPRHTPHVDQSAGQPGQGAVAGSAVGSKDGNPEKQGKPPAG